MYNLCLFSCSWSGTSGPWKEAENSTSRLACYPADPRRSVPVGWRNGATSALFSCLLLELCTAARTDKNNECLRLVMCADVDGYRGPFKFCNNQAHIEFPSKWTLCGTEAQIRRSMRLVVDGRIRAVSERLRWHFHWRAFWPETAQ